ncbi:MAG: hypothetical protein QOC85_2696 [Streptomyces sp.]|nr:hypothetical protein [Streptomyces sp.]
MRARIGSVRNAHVCGGVPAPGQPFNLLLLVELLPKQPLILRRRNYYML